MATISRRNFLHALQVGGSIAALPKIARSAASQPSNKPKYYIHVCLEGGPDPVVTVDPKRASEVERWVDVPYPASEIVETKHMRLGPHFSALAPFADEFALTVGILNFTANHNTGLQQATRLATFTNREAPSIFEILGEQRTTQALGNVTLGWGSNSSAGSFTHGSLVGADPNYSKTPDVLEMLDKTHPDQLRALARGLRRELRAIQGSRDPALQSAARHVASMADFYERYAKAAPFKVEQWADVPSGFEFLRCPDKLQRALWLIENDLTRCVYVLIGGMAFDTHFYNEPKQSKLSTLFAASFANTLKGLKGRKQGGKPLEELTSVSVSTEIGRFPMLNMKKGKDHFPQTFMMLHGPWYKPGVYGNTDRKMEATALDMRTGSPSGKGSQKERLRLDDFGATFLRIAGIDGTLFGYDGRVLDFLRR